MGTLTRRPYPNLLAFREAERLSQVEAAALVGITQAHWSRLETGDSGASPKLAKRISERTGVPMETLLDFGPYESVPDSTTRPKGHLGKPKKIP